MFDCRRYLRKELNMKRILLGSLMLISSLALADIGASANASERANNNRMGVTKYEHHYRHHHKHHHRRHVHKAASLEKKSY